MKSRAEGITHQLYKDKASPTLVRLRKEDQKYKTSLALHEDLSPPK